MHGTALPPVSDEKQLIWYALQQLILVAYRFYNTTKIHHLLLEYGRYGNKIWYMYQLNQIRKKKVPPSKC